MGKGLVRACRVGPRFEVSPRALVGEGSGRPCSCSTARLWEPTNQGSGAVTAFGVRTLAPYGRRVRAPPTPAAPRRQPGRAARTPCANAELTAVAIAVTVPSWRRQGGRGRWRAGGRCPRVVEDPGWRGRGGWGRRGARTGAPRPLPRSDRQTGVHGPGARRRRPAPPRVGPRRGQRRGSTHARTVPPCAQRQLRAPLLLLPQPLPLPLFPGRLGGGCAWMARCGPAVPRAAADQRPGRERLGRARPPRPRSSPAPRPRTVPPLAVTVGQDGGGHGQQGQGDDDTGAHVGCGGGGVVGGARALGADASARPDEGEVGLHPGVGGRTGPEPCTLAAAMGWRKGSARRSAVLGHRHGAERRQHGSWGLADPLGCAQSARHGSTAAPVAPARTVARSTPGATVARAAPPPRPAAIPRPRGRTFPVPAHSCRAWRLGSGAGGGGRGGGCARGWKGWAGWPSARQGRLDLGGRCAAAARAAGRPAGQHGPQGPGGRCARTPRPSPAPAPHSSTSPTSPGPSGGATRQLYR